MTDTTESGCCADGSFANVILISVQIIKVSTQKAQQFQQDTGRLGTGLNI